MEQKQYPLDRRAFSYFSTKCMFIISLNDDQEFIVFEWRKATGQKRYDGERIMTKMNKKEVALLAQAIYTYAFFGEKSFINLLSRIDNKNAQNKSLVLYHTYKDSQTIITLTLYDNILLLTANKNGVKIAFPIGIDIAYDIYLTLTAFHEHVCHNYIYGKVLQKKSNSDNDNNTNTKNKTFNKNSKNTYENKELYDISDGIPEEIDAKDLLNDIQIPDWE